MPAHAGPTGPANRFLDALATAALLGTGRGGGVAQLTPPGNLDARVAALPKTDAEGSLLELAAAASPWTRAGQVSAAVGELLHPAPDATDDPTPECSPGAASLLARMLRGEHGECLPEWLELAGERGVRVPVDVIPDLLNVAKHTHAVRRGIDTVLGQRGRWLARLNSEWSFAAGATPAESPDEVWQTGSRDQRILLLRDLRATDPARALALLASTWEADPPDDRAKFIPELTTGLSMADEPFLESCLDDRRKPVRTAAAALLVRLPDARFVQRMIDRAAPWLSYQPGRKGGLIRKGSPGQIEVTPPKEFDKSWARDGIEQKPPQGTGEKAFWLQQILAFIPPGHWTRLWSADAATLLAAAVESEFHRPLMQGWCAAATACTDPHWAEAVLLWDSAASKKVDRLYLNVYELAAAIPPRRLEQIFQQSLAGAGRSEVRIRLDLCRHRWSPEFSRAVIALASGDKPAVLLIEQTGHLHPSTAPEVLDVLDRQGSLAKLSPSDSRSLALLEFRAAIHREFTP